MKIINLLDFRCIKNCKPSSNPSNDIHLEANMNYIGNEFEWYYQTLNDTNIYSVVNITLTDVPIHILIVKKNMLNYGTTYNFIIKCKFEFITKKSIHFF